LLLVAAAESPTYRSCFIVADFTVPICAVRAASPLAQAAIIFGIVTYFESPLITFGFVNCCGCQVPPLYLSFCAVVDFTFPVCVDRVTSSITQAVILSLWILSPPFCVSQRASHCLAAILLWCTFSCPFVFPEGRPPSPKWQYFCCGL